MTDRDRLIEFVKNALVAYGHSVNSEITPQEFMADFLLENGVVILPCKIGDYCKIAKRLTADNTGEGDIKIRHSAIETAQLIEIACVTANENGTQIMDISNVFAIKEREDK